MARKAIVDKEIILDLLKRGETTQRVADRFKVSRQAIDLHRKDFINKGLLPDKRAARTGKEPETGPPEKGSFFENYPPVSGQSALIPEQSKDKNVIESLDTQIDLIINAFNALKRLPAVEKELEMLRQENEKARQEIELLKTRENKRLDQENRWMLINKEDMPDN